MPGTPSAATTQPKLSLTIYGATGFTGRLAAEYAQRRYGASGLAWAIAGRSQKKLDALRAELVGSPDESSPPYPVVIVADGDDEEALTSMTRRTKVVASTAGPFSRYGSKLVAACAAQGTDYCDITGETNWVRSMIELYDDEARTSGARLVHCCGHDSVPWDLSVLVLSRELKKRYDDTLGTVEFYDEIEGRPSGGTLETAFGILFGTEKKKKKNSSSSSRLGYDPLLKRTDGTKAATTFIAKNVIGVDRASPFGPFHARAPFVMADVNANVVKRSNALLKYGQSVQYSEGLGCASVARALGSLVSLMTFGFLLFFPPTRYLLRAFVLPKPGEGPTRDQMERGYLKVTGVATGQNTGKKVASRMTFHVDAGYMDTARMLVESALSLSLSDPSLFEGGVAPPGGSSTPAACQGTVLLDRLCDTGTTFEILES